MNSTLKPAFDGKIHAKMSLIPSSLQSWTCIGSIHGLDRMDWVGLL